MAKVNKVTLYMTVCQIEEIQPSKSREIYMARIQKKKSKNYQTLGHFKGVHTPYCNHLELGGTKKEREGGNKGLGFGL